MSDFAVVNTSPARRKTDARATSPGSSRCGGAALLQAPPGWPSFSPCPWGCTKSRYGGNSFRPLCIRNLMPFGSFCRTNPPVDLALHLSLTREQDPYTLKLHHLWQGSSTDPERANHFFPVENHGLWLGGADFHQTEIEFWPSICLEHNSVFNVKLFLSFTIA